MNTDVTNLNSKILVDQTNKKITPKPFKNNNKKTLRPNTITTDRLSAVNTPNTQVLSRSRSKKVKLSKKYSKIPQGSIHSVPMVFNIVLNRYCQPIGFQTDKAISDVKAFHNELIKNHSIIEGTARYNMIRLYCIKLLEGQKPEPLVRVAVGKKDRWPSKLDCLRPLFYLVRDHKVDIAHRQIADRTIRSILYINRLCNGNRHLDLSTIIQKSNIKPEFVKRFNQYLDSDTGKIIPFSGELISKPSVRVLSNGPNGKPKWQTADVEAYALIKSDLHTHFLTLCEATNNMDLYNYMQTIAEGQDRLTKKRLRYIVAVPDKGNKSRLVAISDYWTQVLLEPIMRDIQAYTLKRFKYVSYNKDHSNGFKNLKEHIRADVKSYDITSWTDRYPAELQRIVMAKRYGQKIADAWYHLVVDCDWNIKNSKTSIKYGAGQGMGTNASFDIATLTDLLCLEMIYKQDYKVKLNKRILGKVGDDLWCFDPKDLVYKYYTEDLGIEINLSKSKHSTHANPHGEFVSRNLNNNVDVSRISANICRAVRKNVLDIVQLSTHLQERNCEFVIPIKEILDNLKIKGEHRISVQRTLILLSTCFGEKLELLKLSVESELEDFIAEDPLLQIIKQGDQDYIVHSYLVYSIFSTYHRIIEKSMQVFCATNEFDSSSVLLERQDPQSLWEHTEEEIPMLTSKMIMARSFKALNGMYSLPEFTNLEETLDGLISVDQAMTFKALGVISTSEEVWRPKATKFYNFVSSLVVHEHEVDVPLISEGFINADIIPSRVQSNLKVDVYDSIFTDIKSMKIIGFKSDDDESND